MIVYRITLAKHADKLIASGYAARWNSKDVKIIYTAETRALACLENVVHRNSRGLQENFRIILIEIPRNVHIEIINRDDLPTDWRKFSKMPFTQNIGNEWVKSAKSAVLKIPSVIIPEEHNYLINPAHSDFKHIKHLAQEQFEFDPRLEM
ncbi:MAG TPA: RES family NAD+ phosphorylase [Flavipsychrobacter sp.]|nr:RES family NAD+ phosphorylase [Flavipsychrobacter sp.]